MSILGCLPVLALLLLVLAFGIVLRFLNMVGATAIGTWEWFKNLFKFKNYYKKTETPDKRYDSSDGEYVKYEEVKD